MEEPGAGRSGDVPATGGVPVLQGVTGSLADGICVEEAATNHLPRPAGPGNNSQETSRPRQLSVPVGSALQPNLK